MVCYAVSLIVVSIAYLGFPSCHCDADFGDSRRNRLICRILYQVVAWIENGYVHTTWGVRRISSRKPI